MIPVQLTTAAMALVCSSVGVTAGCLIAPGHAFAGKKAARTVELQKVCFEDRNGQCGHIATITRDKPAEKFRGFIYGFQSGASLVQVGNRTQIGWRGEVLASFITGKGRWAGSARVSFGGDGWDLAGDRSSVGTAGLTTFVHLGLPPRLELYAGAGFAPWAEVSTETISESGIALRGVGGLRVVLSGNDESTKILSSLEVDYNYFNFDTYVRTIGITGNLGLFF